MGEAESIRRAHSERDKQTDARAEWMALAYKLRMGILGKKKYIIKGLIILTISISRLQVSQLSLGSSLEQVNTAFNWNARSPPRLTRN